MSPWVAFVSAITMFPSVVHAGDVEFAAVSAERFVPPVAGVIVTAARANGESTRTRPTAAPAR
jgi:hypothetical protein